MASKRALKVYCTSIGFQDAYVAAPSKKAALEAWGTDKDLFARGAASLVTDPKLSKAALDQPGTVIKMARGTAAEHFAAAAKSQLPKTAARAVKGEPSEDEQPPARKKGPRPDRMPLIRAEAAIEKKNKAYAVSLAAIDARMDSLREERAALRDRRDAEIGRLEQKRDTVQKSYRRAMEEWEE